MGRLTTHILDTANGRPASGVKLELFLVSDDQLVLLKSDVSNADGRCDEPLLEGDACKRAEYMLVFYAGDYFAGIQPLAEPRFLDKVLIQFGIANETEHYHVPLLVSPFSYSTYRGS